MTGGYDVDYLRRTAGLERFGGQRQLLGYLSGSPQDLVHPKSNPIAYVRGS
jgi:hypothetical protein